MPTLNERELAALERVAYRDAIVETDLRPETLLAKVEGLYPPLLRTASAGETAGYRELTDGFNVVHGSRVGTVLAVVGLVEDAMGRPLLPAVAVERDSGLPGPWYFEMAAHAEQVTERVPDSERGRRAMWSTHVYDVWRRWER